MPIPKSFQSGLKLLASPIVLLTLIGGIYTLTRVPDGERARVFAMLALTTVGALELVAAASHAVRGMRSRAQFFAHVLTSIGSLLLGASLLANGNLLLQALGTVPFGSGMLIHARRAREMQARLAAGDRVE